MSDSIMHHANLIYVLFAQAVTLFALQYEIIHSWHFQSSCTLILRED